MRKTFPVFLAAVSASLAVAGTASAAVELITNGGFEQTSQGTSVTNGGGQVGFNGFSVTGWSVPAPNSSPQFTNSYTFLWGPAAGVSGTDADTTGVVGEYGTVELHGPGNGSLNGLTVSPQGGNFIGADPAFQAPGPISQTLNNLHIGQFYLLTFDWAAAQAVCPNCDGTTTEGWQVNFGAQQQSTSPLDTTPNHGFVPWQQTAFEFQAGSTTQTLSFLALGGPGATQPPFALLDGVSLVELPEPGTWALMIMGFGGIGAMVRRRRQQAALA